MFTSSMLIPFPPSNVTRYRMETSTRFTAVNCAEWQIPTEFVESAVEKLKRGPTSISV